MPLPNILPNITTIHEPGNNYMHTPGTKFSRDPEYGEEAQKLIVSDNGYPLESLEIGQGARKNLIYILLPERYIWRM